MIIQDNFKITCSEIYIFLNLLGKDYIEKLPNNLYKFFEKEKIIDYTLDINTNKPLKEQFKSKETLLYISYLNLLYWATEEEKNMLIEIYKKNDKIFFENLEKKNKFSNVNVFENQIKSKSESESNSPKTNVELVEYKSKNIFSKLLNKILKFIRK